MNIHLDTAQDWKSSVTPKQLRYNLYSNDEWQYVLAAMEIRKLVPDAVIYVAMILRQDVIVPLVIGPETQSELETVKGEMTTGYSLMDLAKRVALKRNVYVPGNKLPPDVPADYALTWLRAYCTQRTSVKEDVVMQRWATNRREELMAQKNAHMTALEKEQAEKELMLDFIGHAYVKVHLAWQTPDEMVKRTKLEKNQITWLVEQPLSRFSSENRARYLEDIQRIKEELDVLRIKTGMDLLRESISN